MGKYELRIKINNARKEIDDLNHLIRRLYNKKDMFELEMKKTWNKRCVLKSFIQVDIVELWHGMYDSYYETIENNESL